MAQIALSADVAAPPQPLALYGRSAGLPVQPAANEGASGLRQGGDGSPGNGGGYRGRGGFEERPAGVYIGGAKSPRGELLEEMLRHMSVPEENSGRHVDVFV